MTIREFFNGLGGAALGIVIGTIILPIRHLFSHWLIPSWYLEEISNDKKPTLLSNTGSTLAKLVTNPLALPLYIYALFLLFPIIIAGGSGIVIATALGLGLTAAGFAIVSLRNAYLAIIGGVFVGFQERLTHPVKMYGEMIDTSDRLYDYLYPNLAAHYTYTPTAVPAKADLSIESSESKELTDSSARIADTPTSIRIKSPHEIATEHRDAEIARRLQTEQEIRRNNEAIAILLAEQLAEQIANAAPLQEDVIPVEILDASALAEATRQSEATPPPVPREEQADRDALIHHLDSLTMNASWLQGCLTEEEIEAYEQLIEANADKKAEFKSYLDNSPCCAISLNPPVDFPIMVLNNNSISYFERDSLRESIKMTGTLHPTTKETMTPDMLSTAQAAWSTERTEFAAMVRKAIESSQNIHRALGISATHEPAAAAAAAASLIPPHPVGSAFLDARRGKQPEQQALKNLTNYSRD